MNFREAPAVLALVLTACGSGENKEAGPPGGGNGDADDGGLVGSADDGDASRSGGDGDGRDGAVVASEEVCDGIDNDLNGQIDDIDAQGDGVCDCLNIATIGQIGPWSNGGNVFKTWLNERSPADAVELGDQVLTDDLIRPFQVIVVLYVGNDEVTGGSGETLTPHHTFSEDEVAALERWVRNGGGLMTTIGYHDEVSEVVNVNRLLSPLGMIYSTTRKDTGGFVESWEQDHPLTADVRKIRTENGVQPDGSAATTLAWDVGGRVAMQAGQADGGRVVVWGDEWITYDSEWQDTADQQVDRLWLNILKWLSPPKVCQVALPPVL